MKKKNEKDFNLEFMQDYFGNDGVSMRRILRMYIKETPKELEKIEDALRKKKVTLAKIATHQIKLNIQMLGVPGTDSFFDRMQQKDSFENITAQDLEAFRTFYDQTLETIDALKTHFFSSKKTEKRGK